MQVINNIFKWVEAKTNPPTKKDITNALHMNYTMRINITKKTVQHAQIVTEEPPTDHQLTEKKQKQQQEDETLLPEQDDQESLSQNQNLDEGQLTEQHNQEPLLLQDQHWDEAHTTGREFEQSHSQDYDWHVPLTSSQIEEEMLLDITDKFKQD